MRKKIMSMIWKSDPWLIVSGVLRSLVQIILPYITIVFSAEVIMRSREIITKER